MLTITVIQLTMDGGVQRPRALWPLAKILLLVIVLCVIAGCASMHSSRIRRHVHGHDFQAALAMLEENGAGATIASKTAPALIEARSQYQDTVAEEFSKRSRAKLQQGKPRAEVD